MIFYDFYLVDYQLFSIFAIVKEMLPSAEDIKANLEAEETKG